MPRQRVEIKGVTVEWLGHSSVGIYGEKIIYIDPFSEVMETSDQKGDLIISTHPHRDHFDVNAINELTKDDTVVVMKQGCNRSKLIAKSVAEIDPGQSHKAEDIEIRGVPAFNVRRFKAPGQPFHPEGFGMGVILTVNGLTFYYAGDTDFIPIMKEFATENFDISFLPIGGKFTMDLDEAAEAAEVIKSKAIVPVHYNLLKGTEADPQLFKEKVEKATSSEVIIL